MERTAEAFDKFAQGEVAKATARAAEPAPAPQPAPAAPAPLAAAPAPAALAQEPAPAAPTPAAPAAPAAAADAGTPAPVADAPKPADPPEAPASAEPPKRDQQGRFIKVDVHAREMGKRDNRIRELESQLEAVKAAPATPKSIEAFEKLKEKFATGFPAEFQELIGTLSTELLTRDQQIAKMSEALQKQEQETQAVAEAEAATVRSEVDTAIDANPTLKSWRAAIGVEKPSADAQAIWDAAVEHDRMLRMSPSWAEKPMAERFDEAVARTARDFGIAITPKAATPPAPPAPPANPQPKPLPAASAPASLSQIPTGTSPATPANPAANLSLHGAIAATRGMSRAQAERFLLGGG